MVQPIDIDDLTRAILDSSTEFGIILSDQRGRVVFWNEGARRITGWTAEEVVGNSADRMFTPEAIAAAVPEREMDSALAGGRSPDERWHVRKDGSRFWGSGMMHPLRQGGELCGFVKIVRDLTERRTAEERQTLLTRELQHRINNVLSLVQAIAAQTLRADVPVENAPGLLQQASGSEPSASGAHRCELGRGAGQRHREAGAQTSCPPSPTGWYCTATKMCFFLHRRRSACS